MASSTHKVEGGVSCAPGCVQKLSVNSLRIRALRFGVRPEDLERLVKATGGICMICRRCHASVIEHCHDLGVVRGLVCRWCNNAIAMWEEMPATRRGRGSILLRRFKCICLDGEERVAFDYENLVYRFVDHAYDVAITARYDIAVAFTLLVERPYPGTAVGTTPLWLSWSSSKS